VDTVELFIQATADYYNEIRNDENGRLRSWEHCYYNFYRARREQASDVDYLSLHLAFYLASWGMYRGSSFLLQKDYRIHIPVIEEVLKKKYDILFSVDCKEIFEVDNQNLLRSLNDFISEYYDEVRRFVKGADLKSDLSSTLVTKVLMGTLGCVPAYDRYFIAGIKRENIATGNYNIKSIVQLAKFYEDNYEKFEAIRKTLVINDILYPQMKLIDMGFWQIGMDI